jgi:hypothetical protein
MRVLLTGMSALLLCGCAGRSNMDLLQARLREQQQYLADNERRLSDIQSELARSRREADQLRSQLADSGKNLIPAEYSDSLVEVRKLHIQSLVSGGVNRDERPGDDAVVVLLSLVDDDGDAIKLPGSLQMTLIDPAFPEHERQVGEWRFSPAECRAKWTRGLTGAGFQFTVPLAKPVEHSQLVLHAKLTIGDGRAFDASQMIRVTPAKLPAAGDVESSAPAIPQELDDINDPPPAPVGSSNREASRGDPQLPEWAEPGNSQASSKPRPPVLQDSSVWTKDNVPQLR